MANAAATQSAISAFVTRTVEGNDGPETETLYSVTWTNRETKEVFSSRHFAADRLSAVDKFAVKHFGKTAAFHRNNGVTAGGMILGQIAKKGWTVAPEASFDVEPVEKGS